jgi:hypothetical protein
MPADDSTASHPTDTQATIDIVKVSHVRSTAATIEATVTVVINGVTYQATHHIRVYAADEE